MTREVYFLRFTAIFLQIRNRGFRAFCRYRGQTIIDHQHSRIGKFIICDENKKTLSNIMDATADGGLGTRSGHHQAGDGRDAPHARRELRV
jgi:hypothetical protein